MNINFIHWYLKNCPAANICVLCKDKTELNFLTDLLSKRFFESTITIQRRNDLTRIKYGFSNIDIFILNENNLRGRRADVIFLTTLELFNINKTLIMPLTTVTDKFKFIYALDTGMVWFDGNN